MGTEALRCEARVSWRAFETRKACDLRAKVLFPLKKPRVNSNATPRGCMERTFCTLDEHYHTHTHNTKHLYSTRASTTTTSTTTTRRTLA